MITDKIKYKVGTMSKSPWHMDKEEYKIWQEKMQIEIKEYLFSIGQPFVYFKPGKVVVEHGDGRIEYLDR